MKPKSRQETPRRKLTPLLIFPLKDNKENIETTPAMPKSTGLKLFTKIRPPKIESTTDKEQRPLTATLEEPKILNVKLITKIDMSKIRKEFLNITNICRIPLTVKVKKKKQIVHRPLNICASEVTSLRGRKMESSDESWEDEESLRNSRLEKIPKNKLKSTIPRTTLRCIPRKSAVFSDKNNNKSVVNVEKKGSSLTTPNINRDIAVRKEVLVSTKVPEPCKTCGRSNQPERFHSHPETPLRTMKKVEVSVSLPVKNSVQKPVAIKYKSKKQTIQKPLLARKPSLPPQVLKHSPPPTTQTAAMNASKPVSRASSAKRTLTCYICGREFGTASLPLHEPKCLEKWERENKNLPAHLRRSAPIKPDPNCPVEEWNRKAVETFESKLLPCLRCGRTFNPESLIVHQRSCKESQNAITKPSIDNHKMSLHNNIEQLSSPKSPLNVECISCGKKFGTHSIKIHERQCLKKNQFELVTPSHVTRDTQGSNNLKSHSLMARNRSGTKSRPSSERKPNIFPCYLCGKMFSTASIHIHEPQCLKMWRMENEKLPPHRRRKEPSKPEVKYTSDGKIDIEATAEDCWQTHLSQLVACKFCSRTFNPDRVDVHEKNCKG